MAARLSIVVLPFANRSGDPAQDYLADVITDELTTVLARIRGSFVIARSTAFTYKDKATGLRSGPRHGLGARRGPVHRLRSGSTPGAASGCGTASTTSRTQTPSTPASRRSWRLLRPRHPASAAYVG